MKDPFREIFRKTILTECQFRITIKLCLANVGSRFTSAGQETKDDRELIYDLGHSIKS